MSNRVKSFLIGFLGGSIFFAGLLHGVLWRFPPGILPGGWR